MACKTILIVDDDVDLRESVQMVLSSEGYQTLTAENGSAAINLLKSKKEASEIPGCILLDLMMPVMDGVSFMKKIHAEHAESLAKIPVIVCTAKGGSDSFVSELPYPAQIMKKPVELQDLLKVVSKHCCSHKA